MTNYRSRVYTILRKQPNKCSLSKNRDPELPQSIFNFILSISSGGSVMKYYDARIIEGCCVFSFEVKTPDRSEKKDRKRKNTKHNGFSLKEAFLRFIFLLLLPFTLLWSRAVQSAAKLSGLLQRLFRECSVCREVTACILSSVSATALIPLILLLL